MDLSVILVSYNTSEMTLKALSALYKTEPTVNFETYVIDNSSRDNTVELVASNFPKVKIVQNQINVGFGRANNQVLNQISGRYVLLLNTDAFVEPDTLQKTIKFMDLHSEVGVLGVRLIGSDGVLQPSCRYFPTPWNLFLERSGIKRFFPRAQLVDNMSWSHSTVRYCDWVPGCFYLTRTRVIKDLGLFDSRYFMYYEEVDHCLTVKKAGWEVAYFPYTSVIHIGGESAKTDNTLSKKSKQVSELQIESELLFMRKNYGVKGICYHVLLTILAESISITKNLFRLDFSLQKDVKRLITFFSILLSTKFGLISLH